MGREAGCVSQKLILGTSALKKKSLREHTLDAIGPNPRNVLHGFLKEFGFAFLRRDVVMTWCRRESWVGKLHADNSSNSRHEVEVVQLGEGCRVQQVWVSRILKVYFICQG